ncbi:hypothetical protein EsDP_00001081 [Epichloe bromicola]|uniref:U3 snoRNA associated n=1 Tax=Epichloe bromicola TaxID=79588 RepID=A0ABQ0CHA0_9HYPO
MPVQTRKRKAALAESSQAGPEAGPSTGNNTPTKRRKNLPVRSKEDEAAAAKEEEKLKGNVITFDDQGNADMELAVPATDPAAPLSRREESGGSDSDEAPEAVSTSKVAKEIMESAQAVKKMAQEQAAASKKRRQQRDALFKQQASERKDANPDDDVPSLPAPGRKRAERTAIPDVLPAEFLTDSSSEEDEEDASRDQGDASGSTRRGRSIPSIEKRLARQGRGPRDEAIGSTVYRVSRDLDARLAPKVRKYARSSKHALLKRGREPVKGAGSSFFRK